MRTRKIQTDGYAAIRESNGREFIDMSTFSQVLCLAKAKAQHTAGAIPNWAKNHPIQRFAEVTITERSN